MIVYLIRLRKILLCDVLFYLLLVICLFYVCFRINYKVISNYNDSSKMAIGEIESLHIDGNKLKMVLYAKEKVLVTYYFKNNNQVNRFIDNVNLGDKLKIYGTFSRASNNTTDGLFNYRKYLKRSGIYYTVKADNIYLLSKNKKLYYTIKKYIIKRINNNPYLYTFILGDTSYINFNVLKSYRDNGISHLFSISGMHITLISSSLLKLLKAIAIKEKGRYVFTSLFLLFYLFLTGLSPSVLRAVLFFLLFSINKIYYFHIKNVNIFILVLVICLFIDPFYIYNIGFLYSFVISFFLIMFSNYISGYDSYLRQLLITSIISFFASIPISLYNFYQLNFFSILYNLFYVPFVSLIVFPISIITFLFPFVRGVFNILIFILEKSSLLVKTFNMVVIFKKLNIFVYIVYYLLIMLFFIGIKNKNYYLCFFFLIFILGHYLLPIFDNSIYIKMLDVGQGDSILFHIKNKNVLIDTGGIMNYYKDEKEDNYSIVENITIPFLKSRGIKKIDYLILTHGDYDHMGEAFKFVSNFNVSKILINDGYKNYLERNLIKKFKNYSVAYEGYKFIIGDYLFLSINSDLGEENDSSLVFYVTNGKYKLLFMGDASVKSENYILKKYDLCCVNILKVGHHGSKTSSSEKFIESIQPDLALIGVGINNKFKHPHKEIIDRLKKYDVKYYRTDEDGSIEIKLNKKGYKIETCKP